MDIAKSDLTGVVTGIKTIRGDYGDGLSFVLEQTMPAGRDQTKLNREEVTGWGEQATMIKPLVEGQRVFIKDAVIARRKTDDGVKVYFRLTSQSIIGVIGGAAAVRSTIAPDLDMPTAAPSRAAEPAMLPKAPAPAAMPRVTPPIAKPAAPPVVAAPRPAARPQPAQAPTTAKVDVGSLVNKLRGTRAAVTDAPDF
jgi:hypothetical protein